MTHDHVSAASALGEPISPELVLVDPALAARARAVLREPWRPRPRMAQRVLPRPAIAGVPQLPVAHVVHPPQFVVTARAYREPRRFLRLALVALLALLVVLFGPAESTGPAHEVLGEERVVRLHDPGRQSSSAVAGPQTPRPRPWRTVIRWARVRTATYYNFILVLEGRRVLDLHPTAPKVVLTRVAKSNGRRVTLAPGVYKWYVYPGFGLRTAVRYGPVAASGTITVPG
jgi:hypothetical protein